MHVMYVGLISLIHSVDKPIAIKYHMLMAVNIVDGIVDKAISYS